MPNSFPEDSKAIPPSALMPLRFNCSRPDMRDSAPSAPAGPELPGSPGTLMAKADRSGSASCVTDTRIGSRQTARTGTT